jgi:hypothetical protein
MKWFQHDTDASHDAKIKKLILRHGVVGYGVYFHCLELIAGNITKSNINFELEHDTEIIADNLKIKGTDKVSGIEQVNRIMNTIIELKLFSCKNNRIFCFKLAQRLDNTISRSPEINKIKSQRTKNVSTTKKLGANKIKLDKIKSNEIKEDNTNNIVCKQTPTQKTNSFHSQIVEEYYALYKLKYNIKPTFGGMQGKIIQNLLKQYPADDLIKWLQAYFNSNDPFWVKAGHSLNVFVSSLDSIRTGSYKKAAGNGIIKGDKVSELRAMGFFDDDEKEI